MPSNTGGRLLHLQPEDAHCHGDKGPTQHGNSLKYLNKLTTLYTSGILLMMGFFVKKTTFHVVTDTSVGATTESTTLLWVRFRIFLTEKSCNIHYKYELSTSQSKHLMDKHVLSLSLSRTSADIYTDFRLLLGAAVIFFSAFNLLMFITKIHFLTQVTGTGFFFNI
jgi:hypothetical protein